MGLISRILGRETRSNALGIPTGVGASATIKADDPYIAQWFGDRGSHPSLSPRAVEGLSTVVACTNAIATALALVPVNVYQRDADNNRVEVFNHPISRMVRRGPNDLMTWPDFIEHVIASTLLTGNGLATIERGGNGQLSGIRFAPWGMVSPVELSSGRLAYDVTDERGQSRRYMDWEVLHLRDRTDDGKIGRSRLSRAADTVDAVQAANSHARNFLSNGAFPSGVLETDDKLSGEAFENIRKTWRNRYSGSGNVGNTPVLDRGLKWKQSAINPEDAELLETRRFGIEEIARLFQVPPPIIGDYTHGTFTNSETAGRFFATRTLAPWARKLEAEFSRNVLSSDYEVEFDLSGFERADPEKRWAGHKIAIETGCVHPDEIREAEGWGPRKIPLIDPKIGHNGGPPIEGQD